MFHPQFCGKLWEFSILRLPVTWCASAIIANRCRCAGHCSRRAGTLEWGDSQLSRASELIAISFAIVNWDRQAIESAGNARWINQFTDRSANWVLNRDEPFFADHDIITRASRFFNLIQLGRTIHIVHIPDWLEILQIARKKIGKNVYMRNQSRSLWIILRNVGFGI